MKWAIYDRNGAVRHESLTEYNSDGREVWQDTLEYSGKWMGECFLTVSVKSAYPIDFQIGDYIEYRGERFTINYDPNVIKKARRGTYGEGFTYDSIKFNSLSNELTEIMFHDRVLSDNELHYTSLPDFSFYCKDVDDLADRLQANTDRWCKANGREASEYWMFYTLRNNTSGTSDAGQAQTTYERTVQRAQDVMESCGTASTDSAYTAFTAAVQAEWERVYGTGDSYADSSDDERYDRSISVSGQTVWDAMSMIKQQFGLNFIIRGRNVYIGTAGVPTDHLFEYGKGNGLYEVDRTADTDQKVVTKLHAYGDSTNLPTRYYADLNKSVGGIVTAVNQKDDTQATVFITFTLNIPFEAKLFDSVDSDTSQYVRYAVKVKCGSETPLNAVVTHDKAYDAEDAEGVEYTRVTVAGGTSGGNTAEAVTAFMAEIMEKAIVYFTDGVREDQFASAYCYYATQNLPDNMAVNFLMLPGFPLNSLADICRAEYDAEKDVTNYYITKPAADGSYSKDDEVLFHTEEGSHVVTFSADRHDPYILSPNAATIGIREGDISCTEENDDNGLEKVYPTLEGMTVSDAGLGDGDERIDKVVSADTVEDNGVYPDGEDVEVPGFKIQIPALGFALDDAISDAGASDAKIAMQNGFCGGRTFDIASVREQDDGTWVLNCSRAYDDSLDLWFPYSYAASVVSPSTAMADAYQVLAGDNFILTGLSIKELNYVWAASVRLLRKAIHWLCKNDYTRYVFSPKIDEIYMAREAEQAAADGTASLHDRLKEGDMLLFRDSDLLLDGSVYIDQLNIKENGNNGIPTYEVTLRDEVRVGTLQRIQNAVDSLKSDIASGAVGGGVSATQVNPLIKAYGAKYFLSRLNDDTAAGALTFEKLLTLLSGLRLGDGSYYITEDGAANLAGVVAQYLQTSGYTGAAMHDQGASVYGKDGLGHVVTDYLTVRLKAVFAELEIRRLSYVGGNYLFTHAGSTIISAEELEGASFEENGTTVSPDPVEPVYASDGATVTGWRCWMKADDGDTRTQNMWRTGDMALCQTFNVKEGTTRGASNRYYWRLVTEAGSRSMTFTRTAEDGTQATEERTLDYVILSNADGYLAAPLTDADGRHVYPHVSDTAQRASGVFLGKDDTLRQSGDKAATDTYEPYRTAAATAEKLHGTETLELDTPEAGDVLVQAGCQADTVWTVGEDGSETLAESGLTKERGGIVEILTEGIGGEPCPALNIYSSVNAYRWSRFRVIQISPDGIVAEAKSVLLTSSGDAGDPVPLTVFRGAWSSTVSYGRNDAVSYGGRLWIYTSDTDSTAGVEPSEEAGWTLAADPEASAELRMEIDSSLGLLLAWGETTTLTCTVMRGWTDVTGEVTAWSVSRDSGDEGSDSVWDADASIEGGVTEIGYSSEKNDMGSGLSTTFTVTATVGSSATKVSRSITV